MSCIFIKNLVKKKTKAFELGTNCINQLKYKLDKYINNFASSTNEFNKEILETTGTKLQTEKFIGCNAIDISKFIYNNQSFYDYLKYSFIGKYYERKISLVIWAIVLFFILVGFGLYFWLGLCFLFGILCVVLIVIMIIVFKLLKTGESYKNYYNRTFCNLILNSFKNISFNINTSRELNESEIDSIINELYNKKITSKNIDFSGNVCSGNICDLKLVHETKRTNKNGTTTKNTQTVFEGFYVKINLNNGYNKLKGNTIKITADETMFSSLTEDTVKGIYESDLEFNFNSEEMNKSFDCKISGYLGFKDVDGMMVQVHKIITPSFEQHLLYLRERYNTFNMSINDSGIVLSFDMERSLFQKAKHGELLKLCDTYRDANKKAKLLTANIFGLSDFAYYNVFPFMERLYLLNYLTYLYLSYMDFENYYDINNNSINSYEEQMKLIYEMKNKEFKELYIDKVEQIKNDTKNHLNEIKVEEN